MRILVVTNAYPTADFPASGTFVEQQVRGLRDIGLDVDVMFVDRVQKGMGAYLSLGWELGRLLSRQPVDLVHVMYGGVMADMATLVSHKPTIVSFCGSDLLGELLSGRVRKFMAGCGVNASYRSARRANGIVVKSKNLENALPSDVDRNKVRIIPNGVNLDLFAPRDRQECREKLGWAGDRFHVLFPTTCGDPRKRFELAKAAVEEAERGGLNWEIHQLKSVAHADVPLWLNASDVVLLTSLHEGSPNVIKEALACNVPIVSVDVGDVSERINGVNGSYIAKANPQDLAGKLRLVVSGERRTNGRSAMCELSLRRTAELLHNFYLDTLYSESRSAVCHRVETTGR